MKIGIIGAMHEEIMHLLKEMEVERTVERGKRIFYEGRLYGRSVVLVFSRWGKVAAATTATQLIVEFGVQRIVFTGIAGAIDPELNVGDVVIGRKFFQHDMDARPLMSRYEIPLTGRTCFESDEADIHSAFTAINHFLHEKDAFHAHLAQLGIESPKVVVGDIVSGDQFVHTDSVRNDILENLPEVACVEMEGAAVAQVCADFDIPLLVIRTISDKANHESEITFSVFLEEVAAEYAHCILQKLLPKL